MNVVGATLVGGVASMGGGTVNNIMTGATKGGVFWMRDPRLLVLSVASSLGAFYLWPKFEAASAQAKFEELLAAAGAGPGETSVSYDQFEAALDADTDLARRIGAAVEPHLAPEKRDACAAAPPLRPAIYFEYLHRDGTKWLHEPELKVLARLQILDSKVLYALETVALGAVAVIGAQAGITKAVHPLACVATGVTVCTGGILRDVLCRRDIAIGGQSYALATAFGASAYVALRHLVVRGAQIPLVARIALGFSATVAQRAYVLFRGEFGDDVLWTWKDAEEPPRPPGGA